MASAPMPPKLDFEAGCRALAPHVRHAPWPAKFRPHLPEKFDGSIDLHEFLQIYTTTIIAGVDEPPRGVGALMGGTVSAVPRELCRLVPLNGL